MTRIYPYAVAAGVLLLAGVAIPPAEAQPGAPSLSCADFARNPSGGWTVRAPVTIDLGGHIYSPTVGTIFAAGAMRDGVEMSDVLDRECGNR